MRQKQQKNEVNYENIIHDYRLGFWWCRDTIDAHGALCQRIYTG